MSVISANISMFQYRHRSMHIFTLILARTIVEALGQNVQATGPGIATDATGDVIMPQVKSNNLKASLASDDVEMIRVKPAVFSSLHAISAVSDPLMEMLLIVSSIIHIRKTQQAVRYLDLMRANVLKLQLH